MIVHEYTCASNSVFPLSSFSVFMCRLSSFVYFSLQTQSGLEGVQRKLSSITQVLSDITSDIDKLNVTATQAASMYLY